MKLQGIVALLVILLLGVLAWSFYLINKNQTLQLELKESKENFDALDGFNEVLKYELEIVRDSLNSITKSEPSN